VDQILFSSFPRPSTNLPFCLHWIAQLQIPLRAPRLGSVKDYVLGMPLYSSCTFQTYIPIYKGVISQNGGQLGVLLCLADHLLSFWVTHGMLTAKLSPW